jgi:hypothetical protein
MSSEFDTFVWFQFTCLPLAEAIVSVVALTGSLRKASNHAALLRAAKAAAGPLDIKFDIVPLHSVPIYNGDLEAGGWPAAVAELRAKVTSADALWFSDPEYNFSYSGVLVSEAAIHVDMVVVDYRSLMALDAEELNRLGLTP